MSDSSHVPMHCKVGSYNLRRYQFATLCQLHGKRVTTVTFKTITEIANLEISQETIHVRKYLYLDRLCEKVVLIFDCRTVKIRR